MEKTPMENKKKWTGKRSQRTFRGRNLLQIAMPLGGIGAGCICLNGYGGLQDFSIHHAPATSAEPDRHLPQEAGYALLHLPGEGLTRLVEGPFPPEKIYNLGLKSQGYNGGGFEGLPRFRSCSFKGEYPFGVVRLSDPALPVSVTLTGFSPFIPLDDRSSSIPCAILEYTLRNTSNHRVPFQFSYHVSHLTQKGAEASARSEAIPGLGVSFWNEQPQDSPAYGSAAFGILHGSPRIKAHWFQGGWFDAGSALWREVSSGTFKPNDGLPAGSPYARHGGSVLVEGELLPGESATYPVVITWYFPTMSDPTPSANSTCCSDANCACNRWRPYYASQWKDAREVLFDVRENYASLRKRTQQFHDALFSSTLPSSILDAVSANLSILKSPTVLRYENGDIWGWEGCFCDRGCCSGSCTHVWNYAQSMPHLFPALERTLRERELIESMDERGHINFRAAPPEKTTTHDYHAAADGQLGGIMKVYREWQISGDRDWLKRMLPLARRSMDFCIQQWDPHHTGLLEEPHHNTYDIEFWGPDGMCSSFYIGALTATAALLRDAGQPAEATFYETLTRKGTRNIETQLFNGEYYQQKVTFEGLNDTSFVEILAGLTTEPTEEELLLKAEGPKYQYGSGCLSDGVFGAWLAKLCGLESPQNREHIRRHLQSIFRYNFKPSLWEHANNQRPGYALGDEAGLLLCTWPHGQKPTLPFVYSDEVWTGIEYQAASHLIAEGYIQEGLAIVEAVRSRYNGLARNPWNEYECGSYYARAMASYALLIAVSGFQYSAAAHTLNIAPVTGIDPFRCFFSTASGWGTFTLHKDRLEIRLQEGTLQIDTLNVGSGEHAITLHPNLSVQAGRRCTIQLSG
ncbi:MAG: GH116 family glycosyl hydrolase [Anaerolineales bacterium]